MSQFESFPSFQFFARRVVIIAVVGNDSSYPQHVGGRVMAEGVSSSCQQGPIRGLRGSRLPAVFVGKCEFVAVSPAEPSSPVLGLRGTICLDRHHCWRIGFRSGTVTQEDPEWLSPRILDFHASDCTASSSERSSRIGRGTIDPEELEAALASVRRRHWLLQQSQGINHIPSNDFSLYDHVLDTAAMLGAVPKRFHWTSGTVDLATYFAMARGTAQIAPLAMTKWFDTNYHYIVPEFESNMKFRLGSTKPVDHFIEASVAGVHTRPVLLGPVTFSLVGQVCEAA